MTDQKRAYRMQRRAELQEQTRRRITESAVELHGTVGPARTSMSAVAARAAVRRSTLYRHFPDEAALFDACSAHWAAANPLPDIGAWSAVRDPVERLSLALDELYAFYRRNEGMLDNLFRDETVHPLVAERFVAFRAYLTAATETLMAGRGLRGGAAQRTAAAVGHAIAYSTWKSLATEQGLSDDDAGALMRALVSSTAPGARARRGPARRGARPS
jgi:AcrR family transcriptional regulator